MSSRLERLDARPSTCLVLLLACLAGPSRAQVPDFLCCRPGYEYCCVTRLEPGDVGVHHYAIENPATGEITQRGRAGSLGYLFPDGLLLPPETELRLWVVQARTLRVGSATFVSGRVGETFPLPAINLPLTTGDLDFDLLPDRAEWVLGTDPSEPDTDGDGVDDGQEIRNDTDPLDGVSRASGLLAIATTRNAALELCALDDLLIVAETDGLSVFNVFAAQSPRLLARLPLDDEPIDLTCGEGRARAAVVLPDQVVLVDLRDPAEPVLGDPIAAPGVSSAVLRGDLLHVDTKTIDLRDESVLQEAFVCSDELTWGGGFLLSWCETLDRVFVLDGPPGALSVIGSIVVPGSISGLDERRRLFAGLDHVLITDSEGFTRVDLSEPTAPRLDWRVRSGLNPIDIVGSSDDRLFVTAGPTGPDSLAVTSYDGEGTFEALFDSPGLPRRLLVHQGLVYAASGVDGVAILDVLPPEPADEGPTIELLTPTTGSRVLQGGALDVTARAEDDAQVRNVEIFAEGQRLGSDGSYPFEASFTAPAIVGDRLRVRARAFDRAGHATWSNELDLTLVPELDPPQLIGMTPALGERRLPAGTQVEAAFDEPLEPESIVDRITVQWSGPDNRLDTFDDATLAGSTRLTSDGRRLVFDPEAPLPAGVHRVTVEAGLSDRIGNVTAGPMQWTFELVDLPGCQLAPELSASEFTTIVQAGPSSFLPSCLGNPDQQAVTWYTFVGDGGDWQLSTCPSSGGLGSARFRVYSGGCDGLTCQADSGAQGSCGACPEGRGRRLRLCTEADIRYHVAVEGASVRFVLEPATGPVMAC
ncbi:MAG: Ig-like domain-containing protein [Acidobacteriota bacterium]